MEMRVSQTQTEALVDALRWHVEEGCSFAIEETPVNAFALPEPQKKQAVAVPASTAKPKATVTPLAAPESRQVASLAQAVALAASATSLAELEQAVKAFDGFHIKATATNCVFADGVADSKIMIIGEAPGADEDRQGKPFVGVSGQLLDKMLAAIGLDRAQNCYITNVLNWRPPGNRTPSDDEIALARPFLERHIALVQPKAILLAGGVAAQAVLNSTSSISKLRGSVQRLGMVHGDVWQLDRHTGESRYLVQPSVDSGFRRNDDRENNQTAVGVVSSTYDAQNTPVIATFHPSYLLRTPLARRKAWQDLLAFRQVLGA